MKKSIKRALRAFDFWPYRDWPWLRRAWRWRPALGPRRALSPAAFQPVQLRAGETTPAEMTDAWRAWADLPMGHKMVHYFGIYQRVIDRFAGRPVTVLEVGVQNGASLKMWRRLFHPESIIVGIDIDPDCERFDAPDQLIHVRIGDQSDRAFLADLAAEFAPFDFVTDDGSHVVSHMIATFDALFLDHVSAGGVWLAEDTHTNFAQYWRDKRYSFVDLARDLADVMHAHYRVDDLGLFLASHPRRLQSLSVPRIAAAIEEVAFVDSMIWISKPCRQSLPVGVFNHPAQDGQ